MYIQKQETINLVVVPSNVDIATTEALSMAQEVDPDGDRTIGEESGDNSGVCASGDTSPESRWTKISTARIPLRWEEASPSSCLPGRKGMRSQRWASMGRK